jgi:hypothetical protein
MNSFSVNLTWELLMKQNIAIIANQIRIGLYDLSASKLKDFEAIGIRFPLQICPNGAANSPLANCRVSSWIFYLSQWKEDL